MKKGTIFALAACLIIAGCSNQNNTQTLGTPASSYENMEASPSDSAPESVNDNSQDNGGDYSAPSDASTDDPSNEYDNDTDYSGGPSSSLSDNTSDDNSDTDHDSSSPASGLAGGGADNSHDNDGSSDYNSKNSDTPDADTVTDINDDSSDTDSVTDDKDSSDNASSDDKTSDDESSKQPDNAGYGKIFFVGDSRTVDMFDGNVSEVYDLNAGGIRVFARDGCHCAYLTDVLGSHSMDEFDTLVSWLGCNDNNDAALYEQVYENLLNQGKQVVICTVGPTNDAFLSGDFDTANYPDAKMVAFNQEITSWASSHGVKVIDLYTFVKGNIEISPDGIHYNPKPTTAIWNYILGNL